MQAGAAPFISSSSPTCKHHENKQKKPNTVIYIYIYLFVFTRVFIEKTTMVASLYAAGTPAPHGRSSRALPHKMVPAPAAAQHRPCAQMGNPGVSSQIFSMGLGDT